MDENSEIYAEFQNNRQSLSERLLTNEDYEKLYTTAQYSGDEISTLLLRVFKETGIRYSSLKDLTVEAVNKGQINCLVKRKF